MILRIGPYIAAEYNFGYVAIFYKLENLGVVYYFKSS